MYRPMDNTDLERFLRNIKYDLPHVSDIYLDVNKFSWIEHVRHANDYFNKKAHEKNGITIKIQRGRSRQI